MRFDGQNVNHRNHETNPAWKDSNAAFAKHDNRQLSAAWLIVICRRDMQVTVLSATTNRSDKFLILGWLLTTFGLLTWPLA